MVMYSGIRSCYLCCLVNVSASSLASFPALSSRSLAAWKSGRGPGIFSHMSGVRWYKGFNCAWGQQEEWIYRYSVTYHIYLAIRGQLSYTPSIEHVVSWTICKMLPVCSENFHHFPTTPCSHEERYQGLPAFLYCKRWKAGWSLGTRLPPTLRWTLQERTSILPCVP